MKLAVHNPPLTRVNALVGLIATLGGLGMCLWLQPENIFPVNNMMLPAAALAIGLMLAPLLSMQRNLLSIFQAENILMLGLVYWLLLDLIQETTPLFQVSHADITKAFVMIALFASGIWIASGLLRRRRPPATVAQLDAFRPDANQVFGFIVFCFLAGMFWYIWACSFDVGCLWHSLSGSRFDKPWWRSKLGGWRSFPEHMKYFGYLLPALTVLLWRMRGRFNWQVAWSLLLATIYTIYVIRGGNRRIVGAVLGAAIVTWAMLRPNLTLGDIIKLAIAGALVLMLMHLMLTYRKVGLNYIFSDYKPPEMSNNGLAGGDKNFLRLAQTIHIVPTQHPYVYQKQLVFVLVRPIPRAFWHGKPTGAGFFLLDEINRAPSRVIPLPPVFNRRTLTKSVVGDWYIVAGWAAVLIGGLFTGFMATLANTLLLYGSGAITRLFYGLSMMPMFVGLRAMQELVLMSYPILALLGLLWLRRYWLRRQAGEDEQGSTGPIDPPTRGAPPRSGQS